MQKWEYLCIGAEELPEEILFSKPSSEFLNTFGEDGWELVAMSDGDILFKRPKPDYTLEEPQSTAEI